jgi:hypothetical protein
MDQTTINTIIISLTGFLTGIIPSIIAIGLARGKFKNKDKDKLQFELLTAYKDILYLLQVESNHCRRHSEDIGKSCRTHIRREVEMETRLTWSKRNRKRMVEDKIFELETRINEQNQTSGHKTSLSKVEISR